MLTLGIDIGGSKLALAVADEAGRLRVRRRRPMQPSGRAREDVDRIADDALALLAGAGIEPREIAAVGISAPGPLDAERGMLLGPPNLPGWDAVPVCQWLGERIGVPARLENDADAAALAEWRFGAGRGCRHLVYLTMSTGVGGGLVLDGRLYRGSGLAGEIGHAPIEWPGEPCACGERGCLETYVGGAAWTRRLRATAPATSAVVRLAGSRDSVTPEHVVAAAGQGDDFARAEMDRYNEMLSRAILILAYTLAPERVVLGTIPTHAGEALCLAPLRERVTARLWSGIASKLAIVPSALGDELADYAGLCAAWAEREPSGLGG